MTFDFTSIFQALIILFVAVVTKVLLPYIRTKINIQANAEIEYWVKLAVEAIEQISATQGQKGKAKKEYVINWLKDHHIEFDETKIDAQIESAVYQLKLEAKEIFIKDEDRAEPKNEAVEKVGE